MKTEITADEVAGFLSEHPEFFAELCEHQPELLSSINVPHPQNGQAISLVERQSLILRNRITALETRVTDMLRHGEENDIIADRLVQWSRALLQTDDAALLPQVAVDELKRIFTVPYGALRLWNVDERFASLTCAEPVTEDVKRLASSMVAPFCGSNVGFEAAAWMQAEEGVVQSIAMLPLRIGAHPQAYGLMVLGSPDKDRFHITMGTAFLARIAELASAALSRLVSRQLA